MDDLHALLAKAAKEPIDTDISDYGDEWCEGFKNGQRNILEYLIRQKRAEQETTT